MNRAHPSDPPDINDMVDAHQSVDDEALIAAAVAEAYDAPPVPRTLVRRLDQGIADQWGSSPRLAPPHVALGTVTSLGRTMGRIWPLAIGVAATLTLAFFLLGGSGGYAWASVIQALRQHGTIEVQYAGATRWLDLTNQIVGQQSDSQIRWFDFKRGLVLTRTEGSGQLVSRSLSTDDVPIDTDGLFAVFLCGESLSIKSIRRFRGARVIDQDWKQRQSGGKQFVDLNVRLQTVSDDRFAVTLRLDPKSRLPLSVDTRTELFGDGGSSIGRSFDRRRGNSFRYPLASAEQSLGEYLSNRSIDPQLRRSPSAIASSDRKPATEPGEAGGDRKADDVAERSSMDSSAALLQSSSPAKPTTLVAIGLPTGAANQWKAVEVVSRTDAEVVRRVDDALDRVWTEKGVDPVAGATDVQLLRRAYLDLAGRIPTVTEVRTFLDDTREDRYEHLVDDLLSSPDHASQMAAVWRSFLIPEGVDLNAFGGREAFEKWLAGRFASGAPYDAIVRELLLAEGRLSRSGPLLFYTALKLDAHQLAARTSRAFLGMRLECAECHDHPFEPWTQNDFWSFAAFFARISRPKAELETVSRVMRVHDIEHGEVMLPQTDTVVTPRFLGQTVVVPSSPNPDATGRRRQLAEWLTAAGNPYFARATVNRAWSHLFGRGIVDPVDDFGATNPPLSPQLLDTLASHFIDSGFNLQALLRTIVTCKAYRLTSGSGNLSDAPQHVEVRLRAFAQMNVKTLTAEQLYDCIAVATLLAPENQITDYTALRFGNSQRDGFLRQFAAPSSNRSEFLAGIPQALLLMNGSLTQNATGEQSSGLIRSLQAPFFTDEQRIDVMFMATLSRPATRDEKRWFGEMLAADATADQRAATLSDLLWALINSSEFMFNH